MKAFYKPTLELVNFSRINYLLIFLLLSAMVSCGDDMDGGEMGTPVNEERISDSLVLVSLYNSTGGPDWDSSWDLSMSMETWFGITLRSAGTVEIIELQGNGLVGSIPANINELTDPIALEIRSSELTGGIPAGLDKLTNLRFLRLDDNGLTGGIPSEMTSLSKLEVIDLASNNLTGSIPVGLGALDNMSFLDLAENNLTGSIPSDFGDFTTISFVILRNNDLSGCFPSELLSLCNEVSAFPNPKLPWLGDFDMFCGGFPQLGAACELDGQAGTIDADCNCVI